MIFLCETLVHAAKIEEIKCVLKFDGAFSDRLGRGGGLAMLWRMEGVSVMGYSPNHIDLLGQEVGRTSWRFTGYYGWYF